MVSVEEELEMRKRELCQLQAKLQEAEKIIVSYTIPILKRMLSSNPSFTRSPHL